MRILFLILLSCSIAAAQSAAPAKPKSASAVASKPEMESADVPQIPAVALAFEKQAAIPGAPFSSVVYQPISCTPDGVPVVAYPKSFTPTAGRPITGADFLPSIYSFDPKGSHGFSPTAAPGLYDVWYHSYFVSPSTVYIQVRATDDNTHSTRNLHTHHGDTPQQFYSGQHHEYVLEFDMRGSFKKAVPAPDQYSIVRIAALPDDTFVALAYDEANRAPHFLLLDSDLQILRPIEFPEEMANDPDLLKGETGDLRNAGMAITRLSWWQFASTRNAVLLYQRHGAKLVIEVGPGGAVREVPLKAPEGYDLDFVLPANDRWLMQFRRKGLPEFGDVDTSPQTGNVVLYEVDPSDGSLRRRLDLPPVDKDHSGAILACEQDGKIIGFLPEGDRMVRYTADIPR